MVNTEREEEMHEPPAPPERRVRARLEKQRPPAQIAPDKKNSTATATTTTTTRAMS